MRRASIVVVAGALVFGLAGCWIGDHGGVLTLLPDEIRIGACTGTDPVPVETLDTRERPDCLPVGVPLEFPDGTLLETDAQAAGGTQMSSNSPQQYGWTNVGIYGVVAVQYTDACDDLITWGRSEAIAKLRDAFGDGLGYC